MNDGEYISFSVLFIVHFFFVTIAVVDDLIHFTSFFLFISKITIIKKKSNKK